MIQVASLRYGVIFKKAFSQPDIFKAFVKAILGIDLEIERVETEKSFDPLIGKVDLRFDLFAEDVKNRIIVDIQHARYEDHYDRFLHYHCAALLDLIDSSKSYRPDTRVFTIVVLTSGDRHKKDVLTIDFDPKDANGQGINEIEHKIIYLCPKYVNEQTPKAYREWLQAIDDTLDEQVDETRYRQAAIKKVITMITKDLITPKERADMIEEYNRAELARKEAMESWLEGVQHGKEQGIKEGKQAIVQAMLAKDFDLNTIKEMTGLSDDDI